MPLRSSLTPAVVLGAWPAYLLALLALGSVVAAGRRRAVGHNGPRPEAPETSTPDASPTKEPIR
jgi:hypothetical protein